MCMVNAGCLALYVKIKKLVDEKLSYKNKRPYVVMSSFQQHKEKIFDFYIYEKGGSQRRIRANFSSKEELQRAYDALKKL